MSFCLIHLVRSFEIRVQDLQCRTMETGKNYAAPMALNDENWNFLGEWNRTHTLLLFSQNLAMLAIEWVAIEDAVCWYLATSNKLIIYSHSSSFGTFKRYWMPSCAPPLDVHIFIDSPIRYYDNLLSWHFDERYILFEWELSEHNRNSQQKKKQSF